MQKDLGNHAEEGSFATVVSAAVPGLTTFKERLERFGLFLAMWASP